MINRKEAYKLVLNYNDPKYNYYKLAEELAELSEVILKRYGKKEKHQPPIAKVIEESGDVMLRLKLLITAEGISREVKAREREKLEKLLSYIEKGQYKGGV